MDVGFRDDLVPVDQRGHHRAAIEIAVPGLLMLPCTQGEVAAVPFEAFLGKTEPHLLRAKRHVVVIEHQHCFVFPLSRLDRREVPCSEQNQREVSMRRQLRPVRSMFGAA